MITLPVSPSWDAVGSLRISPRGLPKMARDGHSLLFTAAKLDRQDIGPLP